MGVENGGSATVKDVYTAVDNLRTELGGKIDALAETVNTVAVSHEHRLTVIEQLATTQDARLTTAEAEVKKHSDEISSVRDKLREDEATAKALAAAADKRSTTRRWIAGTAIAVLGLIATVCYILVAIH